MLLHVLCVIRYVVLILVAKADLLNMDQGHSSHIIRIMLLQVCTLSTLHTSCLGVSFGLAISPTQSITSWHSR